MDLHLPAIFMRTDRVERGFGSLAQPGFSVRKHFLSDFFRVEKMEEIINEEILSLFGGI